ncbi:Zinc finger CCCH domain-containing protein 18 [Bienertia sinuspersici]
MVSPLSRSHPRDANVGATTYNLGSDLRWLCFTIVVGNSLFNSVVDSPKNRKWKVDIVIVSSCGWFIESNQCCMLAQVQEELISSIKDVEEGIFHLKRTRLLREVDSAMQHSVCSQKDAEFDHNDSAELDGSKLPFEDVEVEPLDPTDVEVETLEEASYVVGSKCRFRHTDGRWYNGQIVELDGSSARVSFLTPTSEKQMMCKFFRQQRCRFGANCRLSHGMFAHNSALQTTRFWRGAAVLCSSGLHLLPVVLQFPPLFLLFMHVLLPTPGTLVSLSSLKKYVPPCWGQPFVGTSILAVSGTGTNIWREAELESWDDKLNQGLVVFCDDGSSETLGVEAMALSQYAEGSDDDGESDSDYSSCENSEGVQTNTTIFANWENHTRGIASKMMANMGYREGMGLGLMGQGMVNPIPVKVLPPKQSLDHALQSVKDQEHEGSSEKKKKRSRGGKRKRDKKFAEAARAAKQVEELRPDVFSLINTQLATHAQMVNNDYSAKKQKSKEGKKEDRRSLVAYEEEVKELRVRVEKLEDMVNRNRKEKLVFDAAMKKLTATRKALSEAEAKHTSASHAVVSKEKEKRWLRF